MRLIFLWALCCCHSLAAQVDDFSTKYKLLLDQYNSDSSVAYRDIPREQADEVYEELLKLDLTALDPSEQTVLLINAYNFLVVHQIVKNYPVKSVMEIPLFFQSKLDFAGIQLSLDALEKRIVKQSGEPLNHLLMNCGAKSCPVLQFIQNEPLTNYYRKALDSDMIVAQEAEQLLLSKIFNWHLADWGNENKLIEALTPYLDIPADLITQLPVDYLTYDWLLNDDAVTDISQAYYPSQLYVKGGGEIKIFNNNYTQTENGNRANFFSSFIQVLIGTNKNFNFGFDVKIRSVTQGIDGAFSALQFRNQKYDLLSSNPSFARTGISGIGPRIKYQFKNHKRLSILHAVYFVPMSNAEGSLEYGYSDYNNLQIFNQVFYERELTAKTRLFFDFGLHIQNIKTGVHKKANHVTPIEIPVTAIYNWYPKPKVTLYGLANFGQKATIQFRQDADSALDYSVYGQIGGGFKYYLTDNLEAELLYTNFLDTTPGRSAHTFNLGVRLFRF